VVAFFQPIQVSCQAANLGVELLQLLCVSGLGGDQVVPPVKDRRQPLQRLGAPVTQDIRVDAIFGADLRQAFLLFEEV